MLFLFSVIFPTFSLECLLFPIILPIKYFFPFSIDIGALSPVPIGIHCSLGGWHDYDLRSSFNCCYWEVCPLFLCFLLHFAGVHLQASFKEWLCEKYFKFLVYLNLSIFCQHTDWYFSQIYTLFLFDNIFSLRILKTFPILPCIKSVLRICNRFALL